MEVQLSENQSNSIKKIAEEEGLTDFKLKTTPGSLKGDNYMGIITTVSVENHERKLDLILKTASNNEGLRKIAPIRKLFLREIYLYKTVFPEMEKFERQQGVAQTFTGHPKIYATCDDELDEFLILDNLKTAGYKLWNRKEPMNADHVGLVFKEYGKFHAISYAMKEKAPQVYEKLSQNLKHIFEKENNSQEYSKIIKATLEDGFKAIEGDQFATEAFERHSLVAEEFLMDSINETDINSVILHGDCWCNNMLFKYNPKSKPSKVCLIDWQISWIGSPILDLSYFLFTCAPKDIICDYKRYLRMYYDSLRETFKELNCDPEVLLSFATLENDWKKYARYGIHTALMLLKLMLSDGNEVPDITEAANSGKSISETLQFDTVHNEEYNRRILDAITVSGENNWI